jgi:hypothetical protein
MLTSASSEFVALCRSQVTLLTQGLGAALSVVYLTEELVESGIKQTKLIPLVTYPEAVVWEEANASVLPETGNNILPRLLLESQETASAAPYLLSKNVETQAEYQPDEYDHCLLPSRQIVLPLMHEGVLMGLLVTAREDRSWNEREHSEIERVAQTLGDR